MEFLKELKELFLEDIDGALGMLGLTVLVPTLWIILYIFSK